MSTLGESVHEMCEARTTRMSKRTKVLQFVKGTSATPVLETDIRKAEDRLARLVALAFATDHPELFPPSRSTDAGGRTHSREATWDCVAAERKGDGA